MKLTPEFITSQVDQQNAFCDEQMQEVVTKLGFTASLLVVFAGISEVRVTNPVVADMAQCWFANWLERHKDECLKAARGGE